MHSDWLKEVMRLLLTNQNALFQHNVAMIQWNLFLIFGLGAIVTNKFLD